VIGAYHRLWHIEKSFRMSKHDLRARPIYHHKRESIDAHLSIVFASRAVTRLIEERTGCARRPDPADDLRAAGFDAQCGRRPRSSAAGQPTCGLAAP
jgi:hypothetical protein